MVREAMHSLGDVNYKITLVLFFLYQILAHMVFVYLLPEVRNHSYFFSNLRVPQMTPRLNRHVYYIQRASCKSTSLTKSKTQKQNTYDKEH
jgi:hypothetical protein